MTPPTAWFPLGLSVFALFGACVPVSRAAVGTAEAYRPCGLKNGCLPEAYGFYDVFKAAHPGEPAEVLLLELPDEHAAALYGHALVVFALGGTLQIWDHEVGAVKVSTRMPATKQELRAVVTRVYLAAVERAKSTAIRGGPRICFDGAEACNRALRLLAPRRPTRLTLRTADRTRHEGVSFAAGGLVWFYCPEQGTSFVRPVEGENATASILAAVRKSFPAAQIIASSGEVSTGLLAQSGATRRTNLAAQ